jgi:anaerobic selenocysteine-containing dehydrogenase
MADRNEATLSRRDFVRISGLSAAAGVAAAGLASKKAEAGSETTRAGETAASYRETEHVKTYYALARL